MKKRDKPKRLRDLTRKELRKLVKIMDNTMNCLIVAFSTGHTGHKDSVVDHTETLKLLQKMRISDNADQPEGA